MRQLSVPSPANVAHAAQLATVLLTVLKRNLKSVMAVGKKVTGPLNAR